MTRSMSKEDRMRVLVGYLADTGVLLPPTVLYHNLKEQRQITYEQRTVQNYVSECVELGLLERCEQYPTPYYRATDLGRQFADGDVALDDLDAE